MPTKHSASTGTTQKIVQILNKESLSRSDIVSLLSTQGPDKTLLFEHSARIKEQYVGNKVYFRGLIEFSNICHKNCLYCGIRHDNPHVKRYSVTDDEILDAARFAADNNYGSLVLQSGELETLGFTRRVEKLLKDIHKATQSKLRITLSCGEQEKAIYKKWYEAGAQRYLLRIESSSQKLYEKLHPNDELHSYKRRLKCLHDLQKTGYQVGTGVMIGLPFQTLQDLADDLLFMKKFDIDMIGMGPYLEHEDTPFYALRHLLIPLEERFQLALKMVAILRIMMKDVNIAATTALQAIDKLGREKAIKIGANVIMPNITPGKYRDDYLLYQNKPCTDENPDDCKSCLEARIALADNEIAYGEWGDSAHYSERNERRDGETGRGGDWEKGRRGEGVTG
ncbi:MAG TPA: [FeFe] hydrogenase H-cluster radical SAM maturase HydE, partial [Bacteroidales bacterium]|nr:[FeFe] hydrogenase H-cluster radical SAM maturase HydE [Bacteroidales bacterium]